MACGRVGYNPGVSLLLLIDGYNVIPPVAPPNGQADPMWLQRERMQLVRRLSQHLQDDVRRRTCVVFDAQQPPRDRPSQFEVDEIEVRFAVNYPEADDLIEEMIAAHSAPKQLAVVSSDHRVQTAARRRGAASFDSQPWLDKLMDGRLQLSPTARKARRVGGEGQGSELSSKPHNDDNDVDQWMREFGF